MTEARIGRWLARQGRRRGGGLGDLARLHAAAGRLRGGDRAFAVGVARGLVFGGTAGPKIAVASSGVSAPIGRPPSRC